MSNPGPSTPPSTTTTTQSIVFPLLAIGATWLTGFTTGGLLATVWYLLNDRQNKRLVDQQQQQQQPQQLQHNAADNSKHKFMDDLENDFHISPAKLYEIMRNFMTEMEHGLSSDQASMKMIPSFVDFMPSGQEKGTVLALDLGGSNFRVVQVMLEGNGQFRSQQKKFSVDDALKTGPAVALFDFLADCISTSLTEFKMSDTEQHYLGFTFSFPVHQTSINSGTLTEWTKGFAATDAEGKDVVQLLTDAIKRKGMSVRVTALVNDTVGTLIAHAYQDAETIAGVINGTGSNAAYVERLPQISKWQGGPNKSGLMLINMEWGGFDSKARRVLPLTRYDLRLDAESVHPGKQLYEKMISGMYLGEIARIVWVELAAQGHLFEGRSSKQLETRNGVDTLLLSRIERDHSSDLRDTRTVLEEILGIYRTTTEDRQIVKRVCELVGIRAARLCAAGIAAVVTKANRLNGCTVAIDGSVFLQYPHFSNRMNDALNELFGVSAENIRMVPARDGSGVGAGLIALLAAQNS